MLDSLATTASAAGASTRRQREASPQPKPEGSLERHAAFVNCFAAPGKTLFTLLVLAASIWPAIGTGASLKEIAKRSGRVRTQEIRLSGLDTEHQYSLLYSISTLDGLGPDARLTVEIAQRAAILGAKTLHAG